MTDVIINSAPLGDLTIASLEEEVPGKLLKAFEVIAGHLHQTLALSGYATKGQCILCSLTVRDFLQDIGFKGARVQPVAFVVRTDTKAGKTLHSLGIGVPQDQRQLKGKWNGHLVVIVDDWLIDTTLYQAQRPQWPALPGMMAIPLIPDPKFHKNMAMVAGISLTNKEDNSTTIAKWHARRNGGWVTAPDSMNSRRSLTVSMMASAFGPQSIS